LHNAVLDADYNRLPGVVFWPGNIGGVVDGPLWSLPCEALLYLMLFSLGVCRLLTLPVSLLLLAGGIVCLRFDTAGETFGSALWLLGFFAAGMCLYQLRGLGARLFAWHWAVLAAIGLALSIPARLLLVAFPLFGSYLVIYLALNRRLPVVRAARFGDLSYGLYIYGWPVEQCVIYATGATAPWWVVFGIAAPVTAALAFLSWHLIEKRCRLHSRPAAQQALAPVAAPVV
jgi:peptidoglycan/LPS O-acetylase OafA/YrhL